MKQNFPGFDPLVDRLIDLALEEDLGPGDVTTRALISPDRQGAAQIRAKRGAAPGTSTIIGNLNLPNSITLIKSDAP